MWKDFAIKPRILIAVRQNRTESFHTSINLAPSTVHFKHTPYQTDTPLTGFSDRFIMQRGRQIRPPTAPSRVCRKKPIYNAQSRLRSPWAELRSLLWAAEFRILRQRCVLKYFQSTKKPHSVLWRAKIKVESTEMADFVLSTYYKQTLVNILILTIFAAVLKNFVV